MCFGRIRYRSDEVECSRKVGSWRRVVVAIRFLVNARDLQIACARVLHETLLVLVLTYGNETVLWKEKERSRIKAVQMGNLIGLLGIRRMDRVPNAWIREVCLVVKRVEERNYEGVLWWFGYLERMEKDRITKSVYVGVCAGSHSVGRLRNRWIDTVKDCVRKRSLDVSQARRMVGISEG